MTAQATTPVDQLIDWEVAARMAAIVGRPGPQIGADQAAQVVGELRAAAAQAAPHVAEVTLMQTTVGSAESVLVVDRSGWVRANTAAFRGLLEPVVAQSFATRGRLPGMGIGSVGSRVTGAEVGSLLGFLSSRVLGQFDPFGDAPGRLLLVAPNVVQTELELGVTPDDFRLWVCLHEETHRVQFTANPWLAEHVMALVRALVSDLMAEPSQLVDRFTAALRGLPDLLRTGGNGGAVLLEAIQTPQQRDQLAEITAVMSLLEGHADVVMDAVGPAVVPSVDAIRTRFSRRRAGRSGVDRVLRRLLGLEAKMRQYADGARFVREVQDAVGVAGFNQVWTSPQTLPRATEIADPAAWVARVHAAG